MIKSSISFLLLATLPDQGIKSLGSKSLLKLNNKPIIEYQLEAIKAACRNIEYEIIMLGCFDNQRIQKNIHKYKDKFNLTFIQQQEDNMNFAGAFLDGLQYKKNTNVVSINYGCLFKKNVISNLIKNNNNTACVASNHKYNDNIIIGCHQNKSQVVNIFFNLDKYKYLDINLWTKETLDYILNNITYSQHKNKFMFELVNMAVHAGYVFNCETVDYKDCLFIDSLNMLTKSKRIFSNDRTANKKT